MSSSPVQKRVQVVPLGFEYARVREPILEWRADVVVAIEYEGSETSMPYVRDLLAELDANDRIELDRRACDIFDLYAALGSITEAIGDYGTDRVYVNLSAGSTITAIAGMIACMASGVTPLYARPDYGPDGERVPTEPLHDEVREVFELPAYPIDRPSDVELAFLDRIAAAGDDETHGRYDGLSKSDLIEFALDREFAFVVRSETTTRKGYYRLLDRHVLEPLAERGYVAVEKIGREKMVSLTPEGRNVLRAFGHLIGAIGNPSREPAE